ncbi:hypothetical protein [Maridesulfovibrio salexigens]|uniref:Uncharacterized protein n=1 Tax=Maridesulfovibrio salexigens (strain ATCC 14822 / DSM 2638 / NCIMB 8403 / VKM B-1763) TaxID=526222 RepID=C6BVI7_MARSD|nr:hypothetical protein [Maridesulfovibrio salexigens]ACS78201.1 hypothetical protein Desal_0130 [Maridesulfovibrio salexigens DSM 2638]
MGRKSILENRFIRPERLIWIAIGLFMILYDRPWAPHADVYSRGMQVSLSGRWLGAGFGLCIILGGLLYEFPKKKYHEQGTICPKCQTPFGVEHGRAPKNGKCPDCDVKLEPIDGFYDRHPELKDEKNEFPEDLMDDLK